MFTTNKKIKENAKKLIRKGEEEPVEIVREINAVVIMFHK